MESVSSPEHERVRVYPGDDGLDALLNSVLHFVACRPASYHDACSENIVCDSYGGCCPVRDVFAGDTFTHSFTRIWSHRSARSLVGKGRLHYVCAHRVPFLLPFELYTSWVLSASYNGRAPPARVHSASCHRVVSRSRNKRELVHVIRNCGCCRRVPNSLVVNVPCEG